MICDVNAMSETGSVRKNNQDAIFRAVLNDIGLFIVADGMGGHYCGEIASKIVVTEISVWWKKTSSFLASITFFEVVKELEKEIKRINNCIAEHYCLLGEIGGTTFCALLIYHDAYAVFNIGDSRLYAYEKRKIRQLTRDDVWENLVSDKCFVNENMSSDLKRGKLTKAMGIEMNVSPTLMCSSMDRRIVFLLCSDGVYRHLKESDLGNALKKIKKQGDVFRESERLKNMIYEDGATDNFSMIMILAEK